MGYYKQFWQPKQGESAIEPWTPEPLEPLTPEEIEELRREYESRQRYKQHRAKMNKPAIRRIKSDWEKKRYRRLLAQAKGYYKPEMNRQLTHGGLIYFIERPGKLVKIGHTTQLSERFRRIKQDWPGAVLLGILKGLPRDEKEIQRMFFQFRDPDRESKAGGYTEWFYLVKPIKLFIKHFCGES